MLIDIHSIPIRLAKTKQFWAEKKEKTLGTWSFFTFLRSLSWTHITLKTNNKHYSTNSMKSFIKQQAKWFITYTIIASHPSQPTCVLLIERLAMSLGFCQMFAEAFSCGRVITIYGLFIVSLRIHDWSTCKIGNFTVTAPNHSAVGGK